MALSETFVVNLIMDATIALLLQKLKIDVDDDAQAGLVRSGRLQDDPTTRKVNVLVYPSDESWPDILDTKSEEHGMHTPGPYFLGGGMFWRRRIKVEFQIFFTNDGSRDLARQKAQLVLGRASHALSEFRPATVIPRDSFGERPYAVQVCKSYLLGGGGDGDWNHRGYLWLEYLTEKDA
jgi:hypothetical protein